MARAQILITIDTDPIPGMFSRPEHFLTHFSRVASQFSGNYKPRVELAKPIRNVNCYTTADLRLAIGTEDTERFVDWAGSHFFTVEETAGVKWFWKTDFNEWMGITAEERRRELKQE